MAQDDNEGSGEGFGSRFLTGLKGLILEDEVPKRAPAAEAPAAPAAAPTRPGGTPAPGQGFVATPAGAPASAPTQAGPAMAGTNSPMFANLMSVALSRVTAYTALTEAMEPLQEIIPDEMTRYKAAFALIKKSRTLEQVVQAIDLQHIEALEEEVARFGVQAKNKQFQDVQQRLDEADGIKARIDAANARIVQLRQELEAQVKTIEDGVARDRQRAQEIDRAVEESRQAIASVQRQFDSAAAAVREQLTSAKAKVLKYLS